MDVCSEDNDPAQYDAQGAVSCESKFEFEEELAMRPSSLYAWSRKLLRHVLSARTSFSFYVLQFLSQCDRRSFPVATALFPIPLPVMDVWNGPCHLGVERRRRTAFQRVLHLVLMAINFVYAPDPWKSLSLMRS